MTTVFLGKLIGLYLVAIACAMLINRTRTMAALDEMTRSAPWMLFSGIVATALGLTIILGHPVWQGILATLVSLTGWIALLKGLMLLLVPTERVARVYIKLGYQKFFSFWMIFVLLLGVALSALAFNVQ